MNLGYNSNVRLGDMVYDVQTEDRGLGHPFIDTMVYSQGRVLHRRTTSYFDLLSEDGVSEAALQQRVEQQHRRVVEELRKGILCFSVPAAKPAADPSAEGPVSETPAKETAPAGLQVQLLNAGSWLAGGKATLHVAVSQQGSGQPASGVQVEARLEGAATPTDVSGETDSEGQVELSFPMPKMGANGGALVIRAGGAAGDAELRYHLKPKSRTVPPEGAAK